MIKISIIDYKNCNIGSVVNMLKYIGTPCEICSVPDMLINSKKIILPGVGSFDSAMKNLIDQGFLDILNHKAKIEQVPILGICLGMQLLTNYSEEGNLSGLGWIKGITKKFTLQKDFNIPHMGWNSVKLIKQSPIVNNFNEKFKFYFVHSYFVKLENQSNSILKTYYGFNFDSLINNNNIYGAQFHPEKSHKYGMVLLKNFSNL